MIVKSPNPSLDLVISLLSSTTPWEVCSKAIQLLIDNSLIKTSNQSGSSLDKDGQSLLLFLAASNLKSLSKNFIVDGIKLKLISKAEPLATNKDYIDDMVKWFGIDNLSSPLAMLDNMSFFDTCLHYFQSREAHSDWSYSSHVIKACPKNILENWHKDDSLYSNKNYRRIEDGVSSNKSMGVVECMTMSSSTNARNYNSSVDKSIEELMNKGLSFDFNLSYKEDDDEEYTNPLATLFNTKEQWLYFIKNGGDPDQIVFKKVFHHSSQDIDKMHLWQYLIKKNDVELSKEVSSWAQQNRLEDKESFLSKSYFDKLKSRSRFNFSSLSNLSKLLREHPNWFKLQDEKGLTAMMHTIHTHDSAYKEFDRVKIKPYLAKKDNQGRSLAFYSLKNLSPNCISQQKFVLSNPDIMKPDSNGNGLLIHILEEKMKSMFSFDKMIPTIKNTNSQDWFGVEPSKTSSMIKLLLDQESHNENIGCLAYQFSDDLVNIKDNNIKGALALYLLIYQNRLPHKQSYIKDPSFKDPTLVEEARKEIGHKIQSLIDSGATLPDLTSEQIDKWTKEVNVDNLNDAIFKMSKNLISTSLKSLSNTKDDKLKTRRI